MAFSKALGRSCAPGGFCFLLGLPWGVEMGVMKLLPVGVLGLSFWLERGTSSCLPPWLEGNKLVMKLDIARSVSGYEENVWGGEDGKEGCATFG